MTAGRSRRLQGAPVGRRVAIALLWVAFALGAWWTPAALAQTDTYVGGTPPALGPVLSPTPGSGPRSPDALGASPGPPGADGATAAAPTTSAPGEAAGEGSLASPPSGAGEQPSGAHADGRPRRHRSAFVESVIPPSEVSWSPALIAENLLIAAVLILLVAFPADLFNATVLANYEEITGWRIVASFNGLREQLARIPPVLSLPLFTAVGGLLYAQLSPDFGFNLPSLALVAGMMLTLLLVSLVYDVSRALYVRRFDIPARLRTQALVLPFAVGLVIVSRLANFAPGYVYGLFTAVIYLRPVEERLDGRGLALGSVLLAAFATVAWFCWDPMEDIASRPGSGAVALGLDAFLAAFWVSGISAIVFGLAPLRFFYGETVRRWSAVGWVVIYGAGLTIFLQTMAHPERGFYARGDVPLPAVLIPFIGFGVFSVAFWGYFRFRPQRAPDDRSGPPMASVGQT